MFEDEVPLTDEDRIEQLVPVFESILQKELEREAAAKSDDERRQARLDSHKAMMKAAFMTNEIATEADFDRLWPRLFDDGLIEYAKTAYMEAMERILEDMEDDEDDDEFVDEDEV
jgi:hypothetical protein